MDKQRLTKAVLDGLDQILLSNEARSDKSTWAELDLDKFDLITLCVELEDDLGKDIEQEVVSESKGVEDLVQTLSTYLALPSYTVSYVEAYKPHETKVIYNVRAPSKVEALNKAFKASYDLESTYQEVIEDMQQQGVDAVVTECTD